MADKEKETKNEPKTDLQKSKEKAKLQREDTLERLVVLGEHLIKQINDGQNPNISIPVRGSRNVEFDTVNKKIVLGGKVAHRYFFNVAHARRFMQTLLVASYAKKDLLEGNLTATLRDLYYAKKHTIPGTKENTIEEQKESDLAIVDLEVALDTFRERLHLRAEPKGRMAGDMVIQDRVRDKIDTIDLSHMGSGGWAVPSIVEQVEFKDLDAEYVLVAEKNAVFDRLNEDEYWAKNKCLIMTTAGQAARGARRLLQRLSQELNLPVYALTDADPYGFYIYSTMKYGSMALAHESDRLGCPAMKFLGMSISDIEHYNLRDVTIKAKDIDIKRAEEIKQYDWFKSKPWQAELNKFLEKKLKAEIQALSSKNLQYISNTYLPDKIKSQDFLP
ncbi:DNA topoisomerase IV subunit A [Candidatus Micrarchaeota archaeon]|nr:DNA topoisomerase IV subunit A [Candidatus Micrarchaeota archaeon]MBI5176486.1 DNA topoisomerase IV subunit A [Candidatus Micrarchaeota archaeon]